MGFPLNFLSVASKLRGLESRGTDAVKQLAQKMKPTPKWKPVDHVSRWSKAKSGSRIRGLYYDILEGDRVLASELDPADIHRWFNTRIFGKPVSAAEAKLKTVNRIPGYGPEAKGGAQYVFPSASTASGQAYELNTGMFHEMKEFTGRHWKKGAGVLVAGYAAGRVDAAAGYMHGGPGYGGYIGFGEGLHSERNALQGAVTNTNYQAQMMGIQALSSNQVAPQYSLTIAPMRQRRASNALMVLP
jgi:hypothetical protein